MNQRRFFIERNGYKFEFVAFEEVDEYGDLHIDYKVLGEHEKYHHARDYKNGIIYFWNLKLDGKKVEGLRILDSSLERELDEMKERAVAARKLEEERVRSYVPNKVRFAVGGDTLHIYVTTDEVFLPGTKPLALEELEEVLNGLSGDKFHRVCDMATHMGDFRTGLYTPGGWYEIEYAKLLPYIEAYRRKKEETRRRQEEERARYEAEKAAMNVKVVERGTAYSEAPDPYAVVEVTDPQTNESARFVCRNIFDCGYVINPDYAVADGLEPGGLPVKTKGVWHWQSYKHREGWHNVRPMTEFEVKAVEYLHRFPPVSKEVRM